MGIQTIEQRRQVPILGKIRLGIRKQAQSGSLYPVSVHYFVLDDAPGVVEVYGKDPTELDIMFPGDDLEKVIPTWLRWFGAGVKNKDGEIIGGKLFCQGNGPDENGNPGVARFFKNRDPKNNTVPTRECLGDRCPDWRDSRGNPQCKAGMQVFCILPRVSWLGVYQIDTTSWFSIRSFHDQLKWMQGMPGGRISFFPFKIVREETVTNYYDHREQKEKTGKQHIMYLRPNEPFLKLYGKDMEAKINALQPVVHKLLPTTPELEEMPMEDNYPVIDTEAEQAAGETAQKIDSAQALVKDPEVAAAFVRLGQAAGNQLSEKDRLILIRKKEKDPKFGKELVLATINQSIETLEARNKTKVPPEVQATQAQAAIPAASDDVGII